MKGNMVNYHYVDRMLNANSNGGYDFNDETIEYLSDIYESYHQCIINIEIDNSLENQVKCYERFLEHIYDDNGKLYRDTRQVIKNLKLRKEICDAEEIDCAQRVLRDDIFSIGKYMKM